LKVGTERTFQLVALWYYRDIINVEYRY
jgi:hypothetical protein